MWAIIFALPNINMSEPIGNDNIAIVPHDDLRINDFVKQSSYAKALVEYFDFYPGVSF